MHRAAALLSWKQYFLLPPNILPISISLPVSTSEGDTLLKRAIHVNGTNVIKFLFVDHLSVGTAFNSVLMKHSGWVCHSNYVKGVKSPECLPGTGKTVPLQLNAAMQCLTELMPKIAKATSSKTFGVNWRKLILEWGLVQDLQLVRCWWKSAFLICLHRKVHRQSCCSWPGRWTWFPKKSTLVGWKSGQLEPAQV